MKKKNIYIFLFLILMFFFGYPFNNLLAEEIELGDAEINAYIERSGELPSIKVDKWSSINITIVDVFSMNWTLFKGKFFNWNEPLKYIYNKVIWSFLFSRGLDRPLNSFLGYTSLSFSPEVISSNPKGWYVKINPNVIVNTTTGKKSYINLDIKIDEAPVDYSVIIRINCTRLDTFGLPYGYSYINIPFKAHPAHYITMELDEKIGYAGLNNLTNFQVNLTNNGYYKDTFFFNLNYSKDIICNADNQVLVLESGETKPITINILTPEKIIDFGTPYQIDISTYSIGDSSNKLIGTYTLITQGVYFSKLFLIYLYPIIITIIFILIYIGLKKRKINKI